MMRYLIDTNELIDYDKFLAIKRMPQYSFVGNTAVFPDEYAALLGVGAPEKTPFCYDPLDGLFDYQRDITAAAIRKRKFAVFADCGLGKTLIFLEFARHALAESGGIILIVSPLMVIPQTIRETSRFYDDTLHIERVSAANLAERLRSDQSGIVITNYEAITEGLSADHLSGLILDESSMLKSHYGKWGTRLIRLGRGLTWKLCCTGTPAPNDRIEYANHAVFLDAFPTVNSFLAKFFVNRGQTSERWALKPHAKQPFFRALSHWCIFLTNPAVYGWKDGCDELPPIHVYIHDIPLTQEQQDLVFEKSGQLFATQAGGIVSRLSYSQIAKGWYKGKPVDTNKPAYIRGLIDSWPDEATIIWCMYNEEQRIMKRTFPEAASISGDTPHDVRQGLIAEFQDGHRRVLISKPKILGFGLNLQVATRQVFSGLADSYEAYYQAVKRSNRYGATKPLNVHLPITDIERPMIETVLEKANRVLQDTTEQERMFHDVATA